MPAGKRDEDEVSVDVERVRGLMQEQFPQWTDLPIAELSEQGTDHTVFRLGDDMVARVPKQPKRSCVARLELLHRSGAATALEAVGADEATIQGARGWVLGPASFGLTYYENVPALLRNQIEAIERALGD